MREGGDRRGGGRGARTAARACAGGLWLFLAGCGEPRYRIEAYEGRYLPAQVRTQSRFVRWEKVLAWDDDPNKKTTAGYVEVQELAVAGTREHREVRYVYDLKTRRVGYLNEKGGTFRYFPDGRAEKLGDWEYAMGVRVLLGLPLKKNVGLERDDEIFVPDE